MRDHKTINEGEREGSSCLAKRKGGKEGTYTLYSKRRTRNIHNSFLIITTVVREKFIIICKRKCVQSYMGSRPFSIKETQIKKFTTQKKKKKRR